MNSTKKATVRCAVYTRKSTEEGLEQEFNSLDAQREAAEAYIASQRHAGWSCLPERYDDGGFSGGHMLRPALTRLLADIAAGKIDAVLVYKVDRLSRSLLDFAKMIEIFDRHHVAFVSVTQQFNSATSMGRLVLNVLLSFAQFEREIISERTRDKIAATRRKGQWSGGMPLLGYDVDERRKLVVNEPEAQQVRTIFALYLKHRSLRAVLEQLDRRGWRSKRWQTRKGSARGDHPFSKSSLHQLLTNVTYLGKVRYKQEAHAGEHQALIDEGTWAKVQHLLQENGPADGDAGPSAEALLKGLLFCAPCGCAMTPVHSIVRHKKYRYYICTTKQKYGTHRCPSKALPADAIENLVIDQIRTLGHDPVTWHNHLVCDQGHVASDLADLLAQSAGLEKDLAHWKEEMRRLARRLAHGKNDATEIGRLSDLQERILAGDAQITAWTERIVSLHQQQVSREELASVQSLLNGAWETTPRGEQARILHHLIERIDHDGAGMSMTFDPAGIKKLAAQVAHPHDEVNR